MDKTYCLKDKKETACIKPTGYQTDKRGRLQFFCHCAVCGIKKVRYVKENGQVKTGSKTGKKNKEKVKKLRSPSYGAGVIDTAVGTAADLFVHHGIPWIAKESVEMGRHGLSEAMRNSNLQKKAVNYGINHMTRFIQKTIGIH